MLRVREKDAKFVIRITHYCVLAATRDTIWLLINVYYVPSLCLSAYNAETLQSA